MDKEVLERTLLYSNNKSLFEFVEGNFNHRSSNNLKKNLKVFYELDEETIILALARVESLEAGVRILDYIVPAITLTTALLVMMSSIKDISIIIIIIFSVFVLTFTIQIRTLHKKKITLVFLKQLLTEVKNKLKRREQQLKVVN